MTLQRCCRKFRKWEKLNKMVCFSCQDCMKRTKNPHETKLYKQKISTHMLWNALNFGTKFSLAIKRFKVDFLTYFGLNWTAPLKSHSVKQDSFHLKQCNLMVHIQEWLLDLNLWFILYHRRPHLQTPIFPKVNRRSNITPEEINGDFSDDSNVKPNFKLFNLQPLDQFRSP